MADALDLEKLVQNPAKLEKHSPTPSIPPRP